MRKTIEILELLKWLDDNFIPANVGISEMMLRDWLKSKLWEPKIGEICEFSEDENFPDDKTVVGYFVCKKNAEAWYSKHKHMPSGSQLPYPYVRPIKGGRECNFLN
jgi:hypothetical protein